MDVIRPGGLAPQKAPRIQHALGHIREQTGGAGYDVSFLGAMEPRAARDWLTQVPGIGKKTASIVLLFCFGQPLMPVDTHVDRVGRRIGLVPPKAGPDEQHEIYWHLLAPEDVHRAHVLLIQHGRRTCDARRPACGRCPIAPRCRFVDSRAP
jgi:endonuclease-3